VISAAIGFLTGSWKTLAVAGAVIAAVAGYALWERAGRAEAETALVMAEARATAYQEAAEANRRALVLVQENARRSEEAVAAAHAGELARLERRTRILTEIENAPETDDGPLSPVLRRAVERLRESRAGDREANRVRPADDPGRPAVLPGGPGGS